jgi:hypothetical protein
MFEPRFALILATFFVASLVASEASATPLVPVGYTNKQGMVCSSSCHAKGGAMPTVTLTGPSTVAAGATANYTLTVGGSNPRCAVAATTGVVLTPTSAALKKDFDELASDGLNKATPTCTFSLVAPKAGPVTIWYLGSNQNGSGTGGDGFRFSTMAVTVTGGTTPPADAGTGDSGSTPTPPTDGGSSPTPSDAGGAAKDSGSGTGTLPDGAVAPGTRDPSNPAFVPADEDGGCNAAGSPVSLSGLFGAASVAGALVLARRRRRSA